MQKTEQIRLTQYSHGAGCGCKISPQILENIIDMGKSSGFPGLIVGNDSKDDAAVYQLNENDLIISTTDFFTPIVDDPFAFGQIAAVNAISDIYAMGGSPLMAIAILGWPVNTLDSSIAGKVIEGGKSICTRTGIPLAGGHSIDSKEPIFGLAVTGKVASQNLKRNNQAKPGDLIYLTKPLGVGLVTTAQKKGLALEDDINRAMNSMLTLNNLGEELGKSVSVTAMTDVTGFGLLGHLIEVCEGSKVSAHLDLTRIPALENIDYYIDLNTRPGGTDRNWTSYSTKVSALDERNRILLSDPQTSGGLLVFVKSSDRQSFENHVNKQGYDISPIGQVIEEQSLKILV